MTTLAYERGTVAKLHTGTRGKIARLIDEARTTPLGDGRMATDDPVLREKLAAAYLDGELLKLISDRALSAELHGRAMGPEGSIAKLLWSETEQHVTELASDVLGPDALSGDWARDRVYSRALTIAGGTTQVNKNILAQRMLGLPARQAERRERTRRAGTWPLRVGERLARREREVARDELAGRDLLDLRLFGRAHVLRLRAAGAEPAAARRRDRRRDLARERGPLVGLARSGRAPGSTRAGRPCTGARAACRARRAG